MKGRTAIVAGGTGLVGKELIKQLLNDPDYEKVIALVRKKMDLEQTGGQSKLEQRVIDFAKLSENLKSSEFAHAHVFCTLGTTIKKAGSKQQFRRVDRDYPLMLAEVASKGQADSFAIVTAMGADRSSSFFYNQVKGEVEDKLRGMRLRALHMLRPSLILGNRGEFRLGEKIGSILSIAVTPLMTGRLRKYRPIHAHTIATGLIRAAKSGKTGAQVLNSDRIAAIAGK
ncbi:NAD(P)H-binding protein [Paenibacillus qinlingensis]|uniref:Uncharacterized protein YbjT (DUF2867 family) n=1 Tax=Paenibacillus qinlingensis TaxID=1837343 RepID=A0ABU1NXG7_9BACL|nr:NAD(P)H-binding protein [Paenibacillus qinlingensis]MDR6551989.1 uncharacterized protein YbjT (DUF2867 family) [Paenibacillus qinlingensis]